MLLNRVIYVSSEKGGAGKTNTTISLGCCLIALGFTVVVIDNDPQGGSTRWQRNIGESVEGFPSVVHITKPLKPNDLSVYNVDFILIDGMPGLDVDNRLRQSVLFLKNLQEDERLSIEVKQDITSHLDRHYGKSQEVTAFTSASVVLSDLVIIPMKASDQDIGPAQNMIDRYIKPRFEATGKPLYFALVNEVPTAETSLQKEINMYFTEQEVPRFQTKIATREFYRKASTMGITLFHSTADKKAAAEFKMLTNEVLEALNINNKRFSV